VAVACLVDAAFATKTARWLEKEPTFLSRKLAAHKQCAESSIG
jgi:hypothetical protein